MSDAIKELGLAYDHYKKLRSMGRSEFIKENGRKGESPWAELMEAVEFALGIKSFVIPVGKALRRVSEDRIRKAQKSVVDNIPDPDDRDLADAVISAFICGRTGR